MTSTKQKRIDFFNSRASHVVFDLICDAIDEEAVRKALEAIDKDYVKDIEGIRQQYLECQPSGK